MTLAHVADRIRIVLANDMSKPTIRLCRIAWALTADSDLTGQRAIARASGVSVRQVKALLPSEGETDPLGLILCVTRGQAGLTPDDLHVGRYKVLSDPGTSGPTYRTSTSTSPGPGEEARASTRGDSGFISSGVPQMLTPALDVWSDTHGMGDVAWALAVLSDGQDYGTPDTPHEVTMATIKNLTGMTDRGVRSMVSRWEEAYGTEGSSGVPVGRVSEPGKATRLVVLFSESDNIGSCNRVQGLQESHEAEVSRHRQRSTPLGLRAWQMAQGSEKPEEIPEEVMDLPTLAAREDAIYALLAEREEPKTEEPTAGRIEPEEPSLADLWRQQERDLWARMATWTQAA